MPSDELLMIATLMGISLMAHVTNSWLVIWKQPSPSMDHTVRSGSPTLAPMAAGTEKPIVPRPPELIQLLGRSYLMNWLAHIWCWPTPDVKMVSGPEISPRRWITYCGDPSPSSVGV